jgi:PII-like signaling protein
MFSKDAPIMLTVIDREEQIEKLIPHLDGMVEEGLIAMSRVEVIRYTRSAEIKQETASGRT